MQRESLVMCRRSSLFGVIAALALSLIQVDTSSAELIGLWRADGDANDASGRENHGTLIDGATFAEGKMGQAFSFDGSGAKVLLAGNPLSELSQFTYVAWVKPEKGNSNLFSQTGENSFGELTFYITGNGGLQALFTSSSNFVTAGDLIRIGEWNHVALTRNGSTVKTYINGEEQSEHSVSDTENVNALDPLQFGSGFVPGYGFKGLIDEVGLFDEVLSQNDIQFIMDGLSGGATAVEAMSWGRVKTEER